MSHRLLSCHRLLPHITNIPQRIQMRGPALQLFVRSLTSGASDGSPDIHTEYTEPPLPEWKEKHGESMSIRKARLLYQSRKRGMLENGLLLSTFAAEYLDKMTEAELEQYDFLINKPSNDWEIYYWAVGVKDVPEEYDTGIMKKLKDHTVNKNKEKRLHQPDLYAS